MFFSSRKQSDTHENQTKTELHCIQITKDAADDQDESPQPLELLKNLSVSTEFSFTHY